MHVAVVGAGAFGGWTALYVLRNGMRVTLIDAWGPGNSQSSSGGETRIIRSIYGSDAISTRFAARSFQLWREHEHEWHTRLYIRSGMLFLYSGTDSFVDASVQNLRENGIHFEQMTAREAARRFPQFDFAGIGSALLEPEAGILTARENCRTVVKHFVEEGGEFRIDSVSQQSITNRLESLSLASGSTLTADVFVFACGAWLGKLFPGILSSILRPTRQDVFFVGPPPGDPSFADSQMPCWVDRTTPEMIYGVPDVGSRGLKIGSDLRGPAIDPDSFDRFIDLNSWNLIRDFIRRRFPRLAGNPVTETRVCQYENTADLGFLIDRHPAADNVWFVGGGSGHGYKHGPAVGEHVANLLAGSAAPEPCFALARLASAVEQKSSSV